MRFPLWLRPSFPPPGIQFSPRATAIVYGTSGIVVVCLVALNSALVGYDTVAIFQSDFNLTQSFWFDRFRPFGLGLSKPGSLCASQILFPGDRFTTNSSFFEWSLLTVDDGHRRDLIYNGSTLQSCDVITEYLDAHLQELTSDYAVVIACDDVHGVKILAKTSFSITLLSGKYLPPLLGAIPEDVGHSVNILKINHSTFINNMLIYASEDFLPLLFKILKSPGTHPVIISGYGPVDWCPGSMGINAPCANKSPGMTAGKATVVFSDGSFKRYNSSTDILQLLGSDVVATGFNLAQTILAAVRIDLGNRNPNNFLFNLSWVDTTLSKTIQSSDSRLYQEVLKQVAGKPELATALVPGPATIQRVYSCKWQIPKPIGTAIVSVMVATYTMFMAGWQLFMFLVVALNSGNPRAGIDDERVSILRSHLFSHIF